MEPIELHPASPPHRGTASRPGSTRRAGPAQCGPDRIRGRCLTGLAAVLVAACGGGGGDKGAATPAPSAVAGASIEAVSTTVPPGAPVPEGPAAAAPAPAPIHTAHIVGHGYGTSLEWWRASLVLPPGLPGAVRSGGGPTRGTGGC
ncbi:MAG: hypothetical protein O9972_47915, partial [Burkholderiales bacterium]|nr:hypothetical protein [Burkholderiales bacterium]